MKIKKNMAMAGLVALLAIPAIGSTNVSNHIHIPSVTAHADVASLSSLPNSKIISMVKSGLGASYINSVNVSKNGNSATVSWNTGGNAGGRAYLSQEGNEVRIHAQALQSAGTATPGGHTLHPVNDLSVAGIKRTDATVPLGVTSSSNNTTKNNNNSTTNGTTNNNSQYQDKNTNNGKLVQTGESNTDTKAGVAGLVLLASSIGFAKLDKAKRDKDAYNAIMGETFNNISSSLK